MGDKLILHPPEVKTGKSAKRVVMKIRGCVECPYVPHPHDALEECCHPKWGREPKMLSKVYYPDFYYPDWCPLPDWEEVV